MIRVEHLPADVLGLSPLQRDALSGRLAHADVARRASDVTPHVDRALPAERAHLAKWLEARATAHAPHVAVLESIRALAQPGASCVVCEAHPAVLLGPWSQWLHALHAVRLASALSTEAAPVVPVLWNHADASDADALRTARLSNRFFELQTVGLSSLGAGRTPLDELTLDAERHGAGALREVLRQLFGDHPSVDDALEVLCPRAGETLASAFTRGVVELLGPHGLVVVEPAMLRSELSHAAADLVGADWIGALRRANAASAETVEGQPDPEREPALVHVGAGGCRALHLGGEGYRFADEPGSRTAAELAAEVVQEPGEWRIGPSLRPLARDLVLPVRAVVGDAAALARHVQLAPVREALGLPRVAFVPAARATLVDADVRASLERFDLELADVLRAGGAWAPPPEADPDPQALERLAAIEADVRAQLAEERKRLVAIDPTLAPVVRAASSGVQEAFRRLAQRVEHTRKNRVGKAERHARRLNAGLVPGGEPQADALAGFPWIARHGRGWLGELLEELEPFESEHVVVHLP